MKAKKILNSTQKVEHFVVQNLENQKNGVNDEMSDLGLNMTANDMTLEDNTIPYRGAISATQPQESVPNQSDGQNRQLMAKLPELKRIPSFISNSTPITGTQLPPMPGLKEIPAFDCFQIGFNEQKELEIKITIDELIDQSVTNIYNCVDNKPNEDQTDSSAESTPSTLEANHSQQPNDSNGSDLYVNLTQIIGPEFANIGPQSDDNLKADVSPSLESNSSANDVMIEQIFKSNVCSIETTNAMINTNNDCVRSQANYENSINGTESMITSCNTVSIDLSDNSNSPKNFTVSDRTDVSSSAQKCSRPLTPLNTSSLHSNTLFTNDSNVLNGISNNRLKTKRKPTNNVKTMTPMRYCAKNFRIFGLTRQSNRHKNSTQDTEQFDYEMPFTDISWSQLDGTQFECTVTKWDDEERRKDILSLLIGMRFVESMFAEDKGVYYCFTAFEGQSNPVDGLKCVMRLESEAVKHQRFSGEVITTMFVVSGQVYVTTENQKQKKTVDTGNKVEIPAHTRYTVENRTVEPIYLYVIVQKSS